MINFFIQVINVWKKRGISNKQMMVIGAIVEECLTKCTKIIQDGNLEMNKTFEKEGIS